VAALLLALAGGALTATSVGAADGGGDEGGASNGELEQALTIEMAVAASARRAF